MSITEQLANALRLCPCRCGREKDFDQDKWVERKCGRCIALERFDQEFMPLRSEEIVQRSQ